MRLSNLSLRKPHIDGYQDKEYHLSAAKLREYVGIGTTRNQEWRDKFLDDFFQRLNFNEFGKDNRVRNVSMPLYSKAVFVGDDFYYKLNKEALPHIRAAAELHARLPLEIQMEMDTAPALAMYEYFCAELALSGGQTKIDNLEISYDDFRKKIGVKPGQYKEFWKLNQTIIQPLIKNINEDSDITVTNMVTVKENRKAVSLRFAVEVKKQFIFKKFTYAEDENEVEAKEKLSGYLCDFGISKQKASNLVERFDTERIARNVNYSQSKATRGEVKSIAGYIVRAIEEDFCKLIEVSPSTQDSQQSLFDCENKGLQGDTDLHDRFAEYKVNVIDDYVASQDEAWLNRVRSELEQQYADDVKFKKALDSRGWGAVYVLSALRNYVKDEALQKPFQRDFEAYKLWLEKQYEAA